MLRAKPIEVVVAPSCEKPVGGVAPDVLCVCNGEPQRVPALRLAVAAALRELYDWLDDETALSYVLTLRSRRVRCPVIKVTIHAGEGMKLLPLVLARIPDAVVRSPKGRPQARPARRRRTRSS